MTILAGIVVAMSCDRFGRVADGEWEEAKFESSERPRSKN